jgi:protein-tyrosine phosphatase
MAMIDIHAHLLPGIDDGARSLEQALNMARQALADGIDTLVLTPHHLNGLYDNPAVGIRAHCASLRRELMAQGIGLRVLPGAECHLVHELPAALRAGTAMTVADRGRAVLVELPVHHVPHGTADILEEIFDLGLQPVIAHPERNAELARDPGLLREWVESGCLAQVTAQSCSGRFGAKVQAAAREMVQAGLIHFAASDAHRDQRRIPELSPGRAIIEAWTRPEVGRLLTETFPAALVQGQEVETERLDEALSAPRRRWWPWRRFERRQGTRE